MGLGLVVDFVELGGLVRGEVLVLGVYREHLLALSVLTVLGGSVLTTHAADGTLALTVLVIAGVLAGTTTLEDRGLLVLTTLVVGGVHTLVDMKPEDNGPVSDLVTFPVQAKAAIGGPVKDLVTWSLISAMSNGLVGSTISLGFRLVGLMEVGTLVICLVGGTFLSS